jgi:hypothetical protein
MQTTPQTYPRTLAIAPSSRGFGFGVMDGFDTLVDWGVKGANGSKNRETLRKVELLLTHYAPEVLVLPDTTAETSRRAPRIKRLNQQIARLASEQGIEVVLFADETVRQMFLGTDKGTKHDLALAIANRYPEELALRVPPKRRPWMSEDYRMDIFSAVALALIVRRHLRH